MASRAAGQHAREKTQELRRFGMWALASFAVIALGSATLLGLSSSGFVILMLGVIGAELLVGSAILTPMERWHRGAKGEEDVGRIIASLEEDGWRAIHDVSVGRGNIDHVLVGPAGLLTVETKSHGGQIDVTRLDQRWLSQAYAEAKLLSEITGREVTPLLVFSRAYLEPEPVTRRRGVVVLPARMLAGHLARREAVLSPDEVRELHARLLAALETQFAT